MAERAWFLCSGGNLCCHDLVAELSYHRETEVRKPLIEAYLDVPYSDTPEVSEEFIVGP